LNIIADVVAEVLPVQTTDVSPEAVEPEIARLQTIAFTS
jgi:hypothetical protein